MIDYDDDDDDYYDYVDDHGGRRPLAVVLSLRLFLPHRPRI
jgi:hypothetical protein